MFQDRMEAGRLLAERLTTYAGRSDAILLGLPRGGVPVAFEIAQKLHLPLGILLVRKLGVPGQPELAMGAIAGNGVKVIDRTLVREFGITEKELASVIEREEIELRDREQIYGKVHSGMALEDRCVIVVDDGIATGASMLAATQVLRAQHPARIVVAVPVAPPRAQQEIAASADECICLCISERFPAVGAFYRDFSQVDDDTVCDLLARSC
jgi:putative phosphoribosyl transferase